MNSNSTPTVTAINDNSLGASLGEDRLKPVRIWLYVIAFLVLVMVGVGGATRLTDSGLSITSWQPISGIIPPLSDADWQAEFEAYQQIPQYTDMNFWMDLEAFKSIFWWEWGHRFLGRMIGFAFAIPFVVFLVQKRFSWKLARPLAVLFVLGGLQGALGWWMVASGLSERVSVSQYRLAAHLSAACLLFVALLVVARGLAPLKKVESVSKGWFWTVIAFGVLIFIQLIAGAFVAGLDAGYGYNTWPLMEGALIPPGLGMLDPWWHNLFENHLTVQFIHRCLGYVVAIAAVWMLVVAGRRQMVSGMHAWMPRLTLLVFAQIVLGIATLLLVIPVPLAVAHQLMAFILVGCVALYATDMARMRR